MKPPVTILFGTMTGNAEGCAIDLTRFLQARGFSCRSENLANYRAVSLADEAVALFVVSTWGDGDPPDDDIPFFDELQTIGAGALAHLRFAVFALGDSSYDVFCGFGKSVDRLLEQAGGSRLLPCEECDLDQDDRLPGWNEQIASALESAVTESAGFGI
jgi:sulfite reductase (NADPH) flavoprotein alpha-component